MDDDLRARVEALEREVEMLKQWRPVAPTPPTPTPPAPPVAPEAGKSAWHLGDAVGNRADLETRIGGKWLAMAGITLLVIAVIVFFRLAVERGWIGLAAQIVLGVLFGLGLWGGGVVMAARQKLTGFAQVLSAGGVAIASFAIFIGHHVDAYQAATGLSLVVDSTLLGLLGLGAALDAGLRRVPVQAATASGLVVWTAIAGLDITSFSLAYTIFMVGALLAVGVWRAWPWMATTAAPASAVVFIAHLAGQTHPGYVFGSIVLVHALIQAAGLRAKAIDSITVIGHVLAWAAFWLLGGWALVLWSDAGIIAWWNFTVAALAFTGALVLKAKELRVIAVVAGAAAAISGPMFLEVEWARIPAWLLLFGAAEWLRRSRDWTTSLSARPVILVLIIAEAINEAFGRIELRIETWILDLCVLLLVAAAAGVAWHGERKAIGNALALPAGNLGLGTVVLLILGAALFTGPGPSVAWAVIAIGLVLAGFAFDEMQLRVSGLAVFAVTLLRVVAVDLAGVDAIYRVLAFAGIAALLLFASWLYVRNAAKSQG